MATLVFAGAAALATEAGTTAAFIATAAATVVGSYLDQKYVYPALGLVPEQQNLQGNRVDDFQLSLASEGSPKNFGSGPKCRVPGTIIYLSKDPKTGGPREVSESTRVGGKSGERVYSYTYFSDIAIGVHTGLVVSKIHSIWANGQLIVTQTRQPALSDIGSVFVVTKYTYTTYNFVNGKWVAVSKVAMKITSTAAGPNLALLVSGRDTVVSGFSTGANNGTFKCLSAARTTGALVSGVVSSTVSLTVTAVSSNSTTKKFTRALGWSGFQVGDKIKAISFPFSGMNNRYFYVTAIVGNDLTVSDPNSYMGTTSGGSITLYSKRLTRPSGSFVTDGYVAGDLVVFNSPGEWKVRLVAATYIEIFEPEGQSPLAYQSKYTVSRITGSITYLDNTNCVSEDSAATPTISQSVPTWDKRKFSNITFYRGNQITKDPTMDADPAADPQVWPNEAYFVIDDLALAEWGNSLPISWSVLVEVDPDDVTLSTAVGRIVERSGLLPAQYDATDLDEEKVHGYFYSGPRSGMEALNPLIVAYDILKQERDGKIFFFRRVSAEEIPVAVGDLAAGEAGSPAPKPALVVRPPVRDLPSEVLVDFINAENDYQKGEARSPRTLALPSTEIVRTVSIPVVLTQDEADKMANRVLWTALANSRGVTVQLPPSYLQPLENDILLIPAFGMTMRVLVQRILRGANHLVIAEGVIEEAQTLSW